MHATLVCAIKLTLALASYDYSVLETCTPHSEVTWSEETPYQSIVAQPFCPEDLRACLETLQNASYDR